MKPMKHQDSNPKVPTEGARELAEKIHRFVHTKAGPGADTAHEGSCKWFVGRIEKMLGSVAASAVARERERCAKIADNLWIGNAKKWGRHVAAAIRESKS